MSHIELFHAAELPASYWQRWSEVQLGNPALASPQFRPEWVQILAQTQRQIEVGVVQQGGAATAFFPFQRTRSAAAVPVGGVLTDIHGLIAPPDTPVDCRQLLAGCGLVSWQFDHLPVDQGWLSRYQLQTDPAPVIDLSRGFEAYWSGKQRTHKDWCNQLRRKERKLARDVGPIHFEPHNTDPEALAILLRWKIQQLSQLGVANPYTTAWVQSTLEAVTRCAQQHFSGCLSTLHAGDRIVAALLVQKSGKHLNAWIPAYDPDYARYSPGALLHVRLAQAAANERLSIIELGRGVNPLKRALASWEMPLAIGKADTRRIGNTISVFVHQLKTQMKRSPALVQSLRLCRRLRSRMLPQQQASTRAAGAQTK